MATKCLDCAYGKFEDEDFGKCRRYPPSVKDTQRVESVGGVIKGYVAFLHIRVHKDDKCGEFLAT